MNKQNLFFLLLISFLLTSGCGSKSLDSEAFVKWIENPSNGFLVENTFSDVLFSLQYKPSEYMLIKENKNNGSANYLKSKAEVDHLIHFNFNMSSLKNNEDALKYDHPDDHLFIKRTQYFSYEAQKDFKLISGKDTLDCVLYHFETSYGLRPHSTIVLGFDKVKADLNKDLILYYKDDVFQLGEIKMTIQAKNIINIPKLRDEEKNT